MMMGEIKNFKRFVAKESYRTFFMRFVEDLEGECGKFFLESTFSRIFNSKNAFSFNDLRKLVEDAKKLSLTKNELIICMDSMNYLNENGYSFAKIRNQFYEDYAIATGARFLYTKFLQKYCYYCKYQKKLAISVYTFPKYPVDIFESFHNIQLFIDKNDEELDAKIFAAAEKVKWMETKISNNYKDYVFSIPDNFQKIFEEADSLKICIAARKNEFISGKLIYVFMRHAEADVPFASIIMNGKDGEVIYAITRYHEDLKGENVDVLNKYLNLISKVKKEGNFKFPLENN